MVDEAETDPIKKISDNNSYFKPGTSEKVISAFQQLDPKTKAKVSRISKSLRKGKSGPKLQAILGNIKKGSPAAKKHLAKMRAKKQLSQLGPFSPSRTEKAAEALANKLKQIIREMMRGNYG